MTRVLVIAKAPIAGRAKTRLGRSVGMRTAAELAAAALLDTLEAGAAAFDECLLALDGELGDGVRRAELADAVRGWHVFAQRGESFGERLAHAHRVAAATGEVVVQVGMDTPQATPEELRAVAELVSDEGVAALGPAADGGWWALGLADAVAAQHLTSVPMSTSRTGEHTRRALVSAGLAVRKARMLRDVDTVADASAVAAQAPATRFARTWASLGVSA